jgi:hypothetical protein
MADVGNLAARQDGHFSSPTALQFGEDEPYAMESDEEHSVHEPWMDTALPLRVGRIEFRL